MLLFRVPGSPRFARFLRGFRERRLYQSLMAYAAFTWVVVEVVERVGAIFPALLPEWSVAVLAGGLLSLLPVVVALSLLLQGAGGAKTVGTEQSKPRPFPHYLALGALAAVLGVTAFLLVTIVPQIPERLFGVISYTERKPTIIGVYPSDGFGPLRRAGVHAYVGQYSQFKVIDLASATVEEMKTGRIDTLLAKLRTILVTDNVIGVIGPPVTEATHAVVQTVAESGEHVPVIIESSGATELLGLRGIRPRIPVFRISSGVDRRAWEIATFLESAVDSGVPVELLIERHSGTGRGRSYGEHLFEHIQYHMGSWQDLVNEGKIRAWYYEAGNIEESFKWIAPLLSGDGIVLLLGIGTDFAALAARFYGDARDDTSPTARFGGWMNAYAVENGLQNRSLRADLLFEITDVDISPGGVRTGPYEHFRRGIGELTPALRDQAFSFDAAHCLLKAYRAVVGEAATGPGRYPRMSNHLRKRIANHLMGSRCEDAVTGNVRFDGEGENEGGRLKFVRFDPRRGRWFEEEDPGALLRPRQRAPATEEGIP